MCAARGQNTLVCNIYILYTKTEEHLLSTVYKIKCEVCGFCRREVLIFIEENPGTDHAIFRLRVLCFCLYFLYKSAFWSKELAKHTYFMLPAKVL